MNKQDFIDLTGEDPEDMFGPDWENEVAELDLSDKLVPTLNDTVTGANL